MSLPPLNPEKTTAGIIVDPKTLERLVPASKRRDGTVRKEIKVRPGFTPQEDVGRFKTSRQIDQESRKGWIPGAGSRPPPSTARPQPVISSTSTPSIASASAVVKSKAAVKNEKRAQKKREDKAAERAWDEDSDDDTGADGVKAAFDEADARHRDISGKGEVGGSEDSFPPLGGGGGAPKTTALQSATPKPVFDQADALDPPPTAPDTAVDAAAASAKNDSPTTTAAAPSIVPPTNPSSRSDQDTWRKPKSTVPPKPSTPRHPIQGKRDGPIGLANPPPIEEPVRGGEGGGRGVRGGRGGRGGGVGGGRGGAVAVESKPAEPRVRKEVRVREGGANDVSRLADRVRNLVVQNQSPREKKPASDGTA